MIDTTVLTAVLVVAAIITATAAVLTVAALLDTRRDLRYVLERGIGNGRRAAAEGESWLAWSRLVQAGLSIGLTGLLIHVTAFRIGLASEVAVEWVVAVVLVALQSAGLCWQAVAASRFRRRILQLGIEDRKRHTDELDQARKDRR